MIVSAGFDLEHERRTFECLRCGYVQAPTLIEQPRLQRR